MAQIFHKSFNSLAKISIVAGGLVALTAVGYAALLFNRNPAVTQQGVSREQPVPFSHDHHVGGLGIDCRYCHTTVEISAKAGVPPTKTCMSCHSQVWKDAEILEPVRASFREDKSVEWLRIHDLPDFVYFDHSIHVKKGVGCESCHGRVDRMPLMLRENTLNMEWCLECHRDPVKNLRPREAIYEMDWTTKFFEKERLNVDEHGHPVMNDLEIQAKLDAEQQNLAREYNVHTQINCSICHR
ncbi:MAG: cytochrome c3 family protein [Planctomycetota bacterium]|nr:cytochrome c3 family protein [Planctomycetota bacterium]